MMPSSKSENIAHELFGKLVKKESKLALKCIKRKVPNEEMERAVSNFLKSSSSQKIYAKSNKRKK